jgi:predicted TIM-barrel fold metal-dependent hydrolase
MNIRDVQAIDVHAHYGRYSHRGGNSELCERLMSADAREVARRAAASNIVRSICSPTSGLFPRGGATAAVGNDEAWRVVPETPGLLQYVIVHPQQPESYEQARRMLGRGRCVGIKIHPEEHCYPIVEHGRALFEFAEELGAVVLTHSGEQRSMPEDIVQFANDFPGVKLILAHIGCGWDGDPSHQVRGVQRNRHGNVYADTSSAMSIMPNLIEWAVGEIGADRVLFGTDTPLYTAAMQRVRIDTANLSDEVKRQILRDNAIRVFGGAGVLGLEEKASPQHVGVGRISS